MLDFWQRLREGLHFKDASARVRFTDLGADSLVVLSVCTQKTGDLLICMVRTLEGHVILLRLERLEVGDRWLDKEKEKKAVRCINGRPVMDVGIFKSQSRHT